MSASSSPDNLPPPDDLVEQLVAGYLAEPRTHHLDATFLPSRERVIEIVDVLRRLLFPGFFEPTRLTRHEIRYHAGELLVRVQRMLYDQIRQALEHEAQRSPSGPCHDGEDPARALTRQFLQRLPELRRRLALDVQAAYDGDPAAKSTDECVYCYPGLAAITVHRLAHELYLLGVPLLPRIMAEHAHGLTGIDIHPGAQIGDSFFIDHGSGVVIGETTQIGRRVKIYQGVTLGALSTKGGQAWRGKKRHPTIEDDVTIYGGAIILGGQTVIGQGTTVGGSVFITESVPPQRTVTMKLQELEIRPKHHPEPEAVQTQPSPAT